MATTLFTSNGTYTAGAGVYKVLVELWAGGGGGGASDVTVAAGGGGGGGSARKLISVTPTYGYNVYVGIAGDAGTAAGDGGAGGDSYFVSTATVLATGGAGGYGSANGGGRGYGGSYSNADVGHEGGDGYDGTATLGGGGGGSGGSDADGNSATSRTGATAVTNGGPGGNGGLSNSVGSAPATGPGGGGGGAGYSSTGRNGGAGYRGQVRVTEVFEVSVSETISVSELISITGMTASEPKPSVADSITVTESRTVRLSDHAISRSNAITIMESVSVSIIYPPSRFYLPTSGAADHSVAYSGDWSYTAGAASRIKSYRTKQGSSEASSSVLYNSGSAPQYVLIRQFVTEQLGAKEWTAADRLKLWVRARQSNASAYINLYAVIRVFSSDGTVLRGVLFSGVVSGTDFNTTLQARGGEVAVEGSVSQQNGDHLVIEIGGVWNAQDSTNYTAYLSFGDNNASDLPESESTTTQNNAWFESTYGIADFVAGTTLNISVSDSIKVLDSVTLSVGAFSVSRADAVGHAEAITIVLSAVILSQAQTITVSELVTVKISDIILSTSQAIVVSEARTVEFAPFTISVSNAIVVSELISRSVSDIVLLTSQAITVTESRTLSFDSRISVADAITVTSSVVWLDIGGSAGQTWSVPGSYQWLCPASVYWVTAEVWGSGAAGGDGAAGGGGGGAGSGGRSQGKIKVTPGVYYNLEVGQGGSSGSNGDTSWFSSAVTVQANGGYAGQSADADFPGQGSAGGNAGYGDTTEAGGAGDNGTTMSGGDGGDAPSGGLGGAGGSSGDNGSPGVQPGGGGGGGGRYGSGADGGAGRVSLSWDTHIEISVSEAIGVSDSCSLVVGSLVLTRSETITVTESRTVALGALAISRSENITVTEVRALTFDSLSVFVSNAISVAEVRTVVESDLVIAVSNSITLTDTGTAFIFVGSYNVSVAETITVTEHQPLLDIVSTFSQTWSSAGSFSWQCPSQVFWVNAEVWGSGGAGGAGAVGGGGGGAGSGGRSEGKVAVVPGTWYNLYVGEYGDQSWFYNYSTVQAEGGTDGGDADDSFPGVKGAGAVAGNGNIATDPGNDGEDGTYPSGGDGGDCPEGGAGGAGSSTFKGVGGAGQSPGGGGGGGGRGGSVGGVGGIGKVALTWDTHIEISVFDAIAVADSRSVVSGTILLSRSESITVIDSRIVTEDPLAVNITNAVVVSEVLSGRVSDIYLLTTQAVVVTEYVAGYSMWGQIYIIENVAVSDTPWISMGSTIWVKTATGWEIATLKVKTGASTWENATRVWYKDSGGWI